MPENKPEKRLSPRQLRMLKERDRERRRQRREDKERHKRVWNKTRMARLFHEHEPEDVKPVENELEEWTE